MISNIYYEGCDDPYCDGWGCYCDQSFNNNQLLRTGKIDPYVYKCFVCSSYEEPNESDIAIPNNTNTDLIDKPYFICDTCKLKLYYPEEFGELVWISSDIPMGIENLISICKQFNPL